MLMVGFHGPDVSPELRTLVEEPLVSGVIWFSRNIQSLAQVRQTNAALRALRPELLIAIDQEGGRVRRLREGVTAVPPMRDVTTEADATRWGTLLGRELRGLGFNLNFAPVLDVDTNPKNPVIGDRSFGRDPERVGLLGAALHAAMMAQGVASCGKHFPGHGDTDADSHLELPRVPHDLDRLRAVEWRPFALAIAAGLPTIMTAHVLVPRLDATLPATFSPIVLERHLRAELGFQGVIVSDDLEMKAVADHWDTETGVQLGLAAGVDLFLVCHELERQYAALGVLRRAEPSRIAQSQARLAALHERLVGNT